MYANAQIKSDPDKSYKESVRYTELEQLPEALNSIDLALKTDTLNRKYLLQKIRILHLNDQCDEGIVVLNKIIAKEKKVDEETFIFFIQLLDCIGETDKATELSIEYIKKHKSPEIILMLAQRFYNFKQYDEAVFYYKELIKLSPQDVDAILDLSVILHSLDKMDELKSLTLEGLKNNKNNILLMNNLTKYFLLQKDYQSALEIQDKIVELNYNVENLKTRATLYEMDKKPLKAYEDYKKIVVLDKCNVDCYSKILEYEYKNQLFEQILANAKKIIECNPAYEESLLELLYTASFFCNDFKKGELYLDKNLMVNPKTFNSNYFKAILLLKNNQYGEVLNYLENSINSENIDTQELTNVNLLIVSYYLLKEDYDGFAKFWKANSLNSLKNTINFTYIESLESKNTQILIEFNRATGSINTSLIIPVKVFKLLREQYNLEINQK